MANDRTTPPPRTTDNRVVHETEIPVERIEREPVHREHHETARRQVPDYLGDAFRSRVSWGAIVAGTIVGVATLMLLSLLGMAIGMSALDFGPGESGFQGFSTGAGVWLVVSQLIALAVGGFVAGRLAAIPKTTSAALHGAAVWGLATLLMFYMATSTIGSLVNTATTAIGSVASSVAQVVPAAMPNQATQNNVSAQTEQVVNSVLSQRQQNRVATAVQQDAQTLAMGDATVGEAVRNLTTTIFGRNGVVGPEDRQQAIAQLAQQTGMTQAEAEQTFDNVQRQVRQVAVNAPATVNTVATEATDAVAGVAFWAFVASLLGLIAAVIGAGIGRPGKHEEHDRAARV